MSFQMTPKHIREAGHEYAEEQLKTAFLAVENSGRIMTENEKDIVYADAYDFKIKQMYEKEAKKK